jgi:hypothetical protein
VRSFHRAQVREPACSGLHSKNAPVSRQPVWLSRFSTHYSKHSRRDPPTVFLCRERRLGCKQARQTGRYLMHQLLSFDLRRNRSATATRPPGKIHPVDAPAEFENGENRRIDPAAVFKFCAAADANFPEVGNPNVPAPTFASRFLRQTCSTLATNLSLRAASHFRSIPSHHSV